MVKSAVKPRSNWRSDRGRSVKGLWPTVTDRLTDHDRPLASLYHLMFMTILYSKSAWNGCSINIYSTWYSYVSKISKSCTSRCRYFRAKTDNPLNFSFHSFSPFPRINIDIRMSLWCLPFIQIYIVGWLSN